MKKIAFVLILLSTIICKGQINRYWDNSFNAEASLISGAVVDSGAGPTALFFNTAQIAEAEYSKLTFNANFETIDYYKVSNALIEQIFKNFENSDFTFNRHRLAGYLGITFNLRANQSNAIIEIN